MRYTVWDAQPSEAYLAGYRAAQLYALGGNMYDGWSMPSQGMRKRIAGWEGKAMTQSTVDPMSGKVVGKNRSFEEVSRYFINAMPAGVREQVLANPELADWLYSYAYNVGPGRFRERVVPALQRYYAGNGSVEDIQRSMWATGDSKLRGLAKRRAVERQGVGNALLHNADTAPMQWQDVRLDDTMADTGYAPMNESLVAGAGIAGNPLYYEDGSRTYTVPDPVATEQPAEAQAPQREANPYQQAMGLMALMDGGNSQEEQTFFTPFLQGNNGNLFGHGGYTRQNGDPVAFDGEGNLVD